ncbi:MAG: TlpA family protein disulfide reductase [Bacteroidales bacterium]|nr:TlpA family protein disulfide reductase [Bacteroidales bacterium]
MNKSFYHHCTLLILLLLAPAFHALGSNELPIPHIKQGTAKVVGSVTNFNIGEGKKLTFGITVINPIGGARKEYTAEIDKNNHFELNVPLVCDKMIVYGGLCSGSIVYWGGCIGLDQDNDLNIKLDFGNKKKASVSMAGGLTGFSYEDLSNLPISLGRFEEFNTIRHDYYRMSPQEYKEYELNKDLKKRIKFAMDSLTFSPVAMKWLLKAFNFRFVGGRLFEYKEEAERIYRIDSIYNMKKLKKYRIEEPDKSYYSFLKEYHLNDPELLYLSSYYSTFMQNLLSVKAFQIPQIKDIPTKQWIDTVKCNIKEMVGLDDGEFYDLLAANAYATQVCENNEPLSAVQKANIREYYETHNRDIAQILLDIDKGALEEASRPDNIYVEPDTIVSKEENEPLQVSPNKLMDSIISKYRGHVVLVDIWATWCPACLMGINQMKDVEEDLKKKGVIFVYITSTTSPKKIWQKKIKTIGGEQYYLTKEKLDGILDSVHSDGYPTYLFYDKQGELKNKSIGFSGVDTIKDELLKLSN